MQAFITPIEVRWSDLDPNVHVRHSVYYDWGALCRIRFLQQHQMTTDTMQQLQIGPILFREECIFKREIRLNDPVTINVELVKSRRDYSRWTFRHTIMKNPETLAAILIVDGAWLDIVKRKLANPKEAVAATFEQMPRAADFEWTD